MAETDRYSLGLEYEMSVTLTELVPKDEAQKPVVTQKVYLDSLYLSYIDSGPIEVIVTNRRTGAEVLRAVRSDFGSALGLIPLGTSLPTDRVYTETGRRDVLARGRAEDILVTLKTNTHLGTRISAISQSGTVVPSM